MTPNPANCELTIFPFFSVFAVHVFVGLFESNPIESPPITQKHWITICVSLPALLACSSQSSPETVYPLPTRLPFNLSLEKLSNLSVSPCGHVHFYFLDLNCHNSQTPNEPIYSPLPRVHVFCPRSMSMANVSGN